MRYLLALILLLPSLSFGQAILRNKATTNAVTGTFTQGEIMSWDEATDGWVDAGITNIISSQLTNGNIVYVDQRVGSDVLVKRWGANWPALSPSGAVAVAQSIDTVWMRPGNYTNNNLLKNGVNYFISEGARIVWKDTGTGTNASRGIFDDRHITGGSTNTIWGYGDFQWRSGQDNVANDPRGLLVITQANSYVFFKARRCDASYTNSIANPNVTGLAGVIHVRNAHRVYVEVEEVLDTFVSYLDGPPEEETAIASSISGVYWALGDLHCRIRRNSTSSYGIWGDEPFGSGNNTNAMWYEGDLITGFPGMYVNCHSPNYKTWTSVREMTSWTAYNGGRHYLNAQKLNREIAVSGHSESWVTVQKMSQSAASAWITVGADLLDTNNPVLHADIMQFEQVAGAAMPQGIRMAGDGSMLRLRGGIGVITNAPWLEHFGGTVELRNTTLITKGTATNAWPVYLHGTNGGVVLADSVLVATPSTAHSIYASNAQTMKIYGHATANTNEAPLVTIQTGAFTVNGNVTAP